jgi:hypothetical protein
MLHFLVCGECDISLCPCGRDVFTVHLTEGAEAKESNAEPGPRFMCPITQLPCGSVPFTALPTCGHVFSSRALREVSRYSLSRVDVWGSPGGALDS